MESVRATTVYTGRVQGVGFRYTVKRLTMGFEVVGTIRNESDGSVCLLIEGEKSELEAFHSAIWESELRGHIRNVETNWEAAKGGFRGFEIVA